MAKISQIYCTIVLMGRVSWRQVCLSSAIHEHLAFHVADYLCFHKVFKCSTTWFKGPENTLFSPSFSHQQSCPNTSIINTFCAPDLCISQYEGLCLSVFSVLIKSRWKKKKTSSIPVRVLTRIHHYQSSYCYEELPNVIYVVRSFETAQRCYFVSLS